MPFTLLHISDLHRANSDPIGNDELLSTLLADRDRFSTEQPSIASPDAIVVSGDLIHGAALGTADYTGEIGAQYATAQEFLVRLADELLAGDRSKLIVVPGNHDVDWNIALAAMSDLTDDEIPQNFSPLLCGATDDLRWDWNKRKVYRINNRDLYDRRLEQFNNTVSDFYAPTTVHRRERYGIHSLFDGRIAIVAFNSCVGNDCFAFHGAIEERAVAEAHLELMGSGHELLAAVWHHSIDGDPYSNDYMSVSTVQRLIGRGFRIGLHGHQHRAAASLRYVHLPKEERMAVISAGSLCAGRYGLPTGVNRQYNVLEIADDLRSVRVHVREMSIATNFAPARRPEFGFKTFVDLDWQLPDSSTAAQAKRSQQTTLDAEKALSEHREDDAIALLGELERGPGSFARRLMIGALGEQKRWDDLVTEISEPGSIEELVILANAYAEAERFEAAEACLRTHGDDLKMPTATADALRRSFKARGILT